RQRAAGEPGSRASRNERDALLPEQPDDGSDLLGRAREGDDLRGRALERVAVALVHGERIGMIDDAVVAEQAAEMRRQAVAHAELLTWSDRSSRPSVRRLIEAGIDLALVEASRCPTPVRNP